MPIWSNFSSKFMQIWVDLSWRFFRWKKKSERSRREKEQFFAAAVKRDRLSELELCEVYVQWAQRRETQKSRKEFHSRFNSVLRWCYVCCKKVNVVGRKTKQKKIKATKKKKRLKTFEKFHYFSSVSSCECALPHMDNLVLSHWLSHLFLFWHCYCADSAIAIVSEGEYLFKKLCDVLQWRMKSSDGRNRLCVNCCCCYCVVLLCPFGTFICVKQLAKYKKSKNK